nr:MAG TPA: internal head protein [Caudoviricetes sp.]
MSIRLEDALRAVDRLSQEDYTVPSEISTPEISDNEINEGIHSIESFSMESFYYSNVVLSFEEERNTFQKFIETSKKFIQALIAKVQEFFAKLLTTTGRLESNLKKARDTVSKTSDFSGKPTEIQKNRFSKYLVLDGKAVSVKEISASVSKSIDSFIGGILDKEPWNIINEKKSFDTAESNPGETAEGLFAKFVDTYADSIGVSLATGTAMLAILPGNVTVSISKKEGLKFSRGENDSRDINDNQLIADKTTAVAACDAVTDIIDVIEMLRKFKGDVWNIDYAEDMAVVDKPDGSDDEIKSLTRAYSAQIRFCQGYINTCSKIAGYLVQVARVLLEMVFISVKGGSDSKEANASEESLKNEEISIKETSVLEATNIDNDPSFKDTTTTAKKGDVPHNPDKDVKDDLAVNVEPQDGSVSIESYIELSKEDGYINTMFDALDHAEEAFSGILDLNQTLVDVKSHESFDPNTQRLYRNAQSSLYKRLGIDVKRHSSESHGDITVSMEEEQSRTKKFFQAIWDFIVKIAEKVYQFVMGLSRVADKNAKKAEKISAALKKAESIHDLPEEKQAKYAKAFYYGDNKVSVANAMQRIVNQFELLDPKAVLNVSTKMCEEMKKNFKYVASESALDANVFGPYMSIVGNLNNALGITKAVSSAPKYFNKGSDNNYFETETLPGNKKICYAIDIRDMQKYTKQQIPEHQRMQASGTIKSAMVSVGDIPDSLSYQEVGQDGLETICEQAKHISKLIKEDQDMLKDLNRNYKSFVKEIQSKSVTGIFTAGTGREQNGHLIIFMVSMLLKQTTSTILSVIKDYNFYALKMSSLSLSLVLDRISSEAKVDIPQDTTLKLGYAAA